MERDNVVAAGAARRPNKLMALTVQIVGSEGHEAVSTVDSIRVLQNWFASSVAIADCALVVQAIGLDRASARDLPWLYAFVELGGRTLYSECFIDDDAELIDAGLTVYAPKRPHAGRRRRPVVVAAGVVASVHGLLVHPGEPLPARMRTLAEVPPVPQTPAPRL